MFDMHPIFLKHYRNLYIAHRDGAKRRGIEFLLTFEEWLKLWVDSGQLDNRGRGTSWGNQPYVEGAFEVLMANS